MPLLEGYEGWRHLHVRRTHGDDERGTWEGRPELERTQVDNMDGSTGGAAEREVIIANARDNLRRVSAGGELSTL
jgi:hypothetical protein